MSDEQNIHKPDLSLIIACYNEEPHLAGSVAEIDEVMHQTQYSYELVFIDDCSKDGTRESIKKICEKRDNCVYVFHGKNVGRGGTVREGLLMARAPYAGFLDIDLEVHARYIPSMVLWLEKGYDVVSIDRIEKLSLSFYKLMRFAVSEGCRQIARYLLHTSFPDSASGFKFFNMSAMRNVIADTKDNGWFWDTEIILRAEEAKKKLKSIQGVFEHRLDKKSTVRLIPDTIAYIKASLDFKKHK